MAGVHRLAANSHDEVGTFAIPDGRYKTVCCNELESRGGRHESQKVKAVTWSCECINFVGLLFFYPTYLNRSISYGNELERVIKEFTVARNWSDISAILVVSLLATASLYLFITAFITEKGSVIPARDERK